MAWPVWLFVPNLIGYVRVVTGLAAFAYAWDDASLFTFFLLYGFSYLLDAVDGVAARRLNQKSRFGAVLDMVTDRICTAGLLGVLAYKYKGAPESTYFIWLMILDIGSHWVQMYRCATRQQAGCQGVGGQRAACRPAPAAHAGNRCKLLPMRSAVQLPGHRVRVSQERRQRAPPAAVLLHVPVRTLLRVPLQ